MIYLTRRYRFSASHRLHSEQMSDDENLRTYGKCNNPHGHGHNYTLYVTINGEVNSATGMVCDLGELDSVVQHEILDRFDHEHLNLLPDFQARVPTSENLAALIFEKLRGNFKAAHLSRVKLDETTQNSFEYGE